MWIWEINYIAKKNENNVYFIHIYIPNNLTLVVFPDSTILDISLPFQPVFLLTGQNAFLPE